MSISSFALAPHADSPKPFTFQQALDMGWTRAGLRRAVEEGEVTHVLTDVYVDGRPDDTLELRLACLRLVLPPHAVVVDRTAAWLWDVSPARTSSAEPQPLDVFVLRGHTRLRRRGADSGERDLMPRDLVLLDGILVTAPLRTALDLACRCRREDALVALDGFARVHGVTQADLVAMLPRFRGRRGIVQARGLIPYVDGRAESSGESVTRLAIIDAGLPIPLPQHWITIAGVPTYRLDLSYPRLKIVVEYNGQDFHSEDEDRQADKDRRRWLRSRGWIVIEVWKDDFSLEAKQRWLGELRQALASRAHWERLART
jgi:hypothetical protein